MRKLIFLCRRRPGITRAQYAERLLEGHVPIALRHHPIMRRYVVNVVAGGEAEGAIDSIGELSFETLADYRDRLYDSPEGQEVVARDVRGFLGAADPYECTERVFGSTTGPRAATRARSSGTKTIVAVRRSAEVSHAELVAYWLERHVPLFLKELPEAARYVANVVDSRLSADAAELDILAELHVPSDAVSAEPEAVARRVHDADPAGFIASVRAWRVAEYVCKLL